MLRMQQSFIRSVEAALAPGRCTSQSVRAAIRAERRRVRWCLRTATILVHRLQEQNRSDEARMVDSEVAGLLGRVLGIEMDARTMRETA